MFEPKIKIRKELYEKIRLAAEALGCTIEEFAEKALASETDKVLAVTGSKRELSSGEVEEIANKLKGLGYLE